MKSIIVHTKTESLLFEKRTSVLPDRNLRVPLADDFYQVLHDWQSASFGFLPRQKNGEAEQPNKPLPSTRMMWYQKLDPSSNGFMPMSREWQFWLLDLLDWASDGKLPRGEFEYYYTRKNEMQNGEIIKTTLSNPQARAKYTDGSLLSVYEDLISDHRAFTDGHAPESGFADYMTGRNLQAQPYQWKSLHATGNIVNVLGTWQTNPKYYIIEALDLTKPPPSVEWVVANKPWLIGWATEQTVVKLTDGRWQVSRFPQIKTAQRVFGYPECGTPFPVIGNGSNLMLKTDLMAIKNGKVYSPYVP